MFLFSTYSSTIGGLGNLDSDVESEIKGRGLRRGYSCTDGSI